MAGYIPAAWRVLFPICIYQIVPKLSANAAIFKGVCPFYKGPFPFAQHSYCERQLVWWRGGALKPGSMAPSLLFHMLAGMILDMLLHLGFFNIKWRS